MRSFDRLFTNHSCGTSVDVPRKPEGEHPLVAHAPYMVWLEVRLLVTQFPYMVRWGVLTGAIWKHLLLLTCRGRVALESETRRRLFGSVSSCRDRLRDLGLAEPMQLSVGRLNNATDGELQDYRTLKTLYGFKLHNFVFKAVNYSVYSRLSRPIKRISRRIGKSCLNAVRS